MVQSAAGLLSPGWLLDEVAGAGRENLEGDHVARYDDIADSRGPAEVALLVELGLDDDSCVVDLGAGTGQFTLAVAPICSRVVAVDVSPVMLERLRAKVGARALPSSTASFRGTSPQSCRQGDTIGRAARVEFEFLPALHRVASELRTSSP